MSKLEYFKNQFIKNGSNFYILDKNDAYVDNFGKQWRDYRDVQIDSKNNFFISRDYLMEMLFDDINILKNKKILEIGSGAGRFTEYLSYYSKECVSLDLSSAIYHNIAKDKSNTSFIKADFNKLISEKKFDIVFCRGVLQHTPNPLKSLLKIHSFINENGYVFFDVYKMPKIGYLHPKYFFWRPLIKNLIKYETFEKFLKKRIKFLLKIKRFIKSILFNSNFLSDSIIPVWDYEDKLNISKSKLEMWSVMDTLDGIYAKYDFPQKNKNIINYLVNNNIKIIKNNKHKNIFKTKLKNIDK
jgi:2-polyprenyl-3-methyl-5-hydroxy-6-metoxy-1,4-benzoquinol methylase